MPIRSIKDERYKGVSELYRKSDGQVTGYYITYRDLEGRPVKKRVDAESREEARAMLREIKEEIERRKKERKMSVAPGAQGERVSDLKEDTAERGTLPPRGVAVPGTPEDFRQAISSWQGESVVLMMEVLAFEDIAICYGYERSERVVRELGDVIRGRLGEWEREERFGAEGTLAGGWRLYPVQGERYCLHIRRDLSPRRVDRLATDLARIVAAHPFRIADGPPIQLTLACGAAKAPGERGLLYARKALREARHAPEGYLYYDGRSFEEEGQHVGRLYETLVRNIKQQGVEPHFQGIYRAGNSGDAGEPCRYESLMRITDESGSPLSPALFLERSREFGLYTRLMAQMIDKVLTLLEEREDLHLTINFSYRDFGNPELFGYLLERIRGSGAGERLTVEILESEEIGDFELMSEKIYALKRLNVGVAIDDFGSGFANFDMVAALDVDYVKIDGSLISRIREPRYRVILENMVAICRDLGIETVAEFVSDETIREMVQEIGVDQMQGYHLHRPEPWERIAVQGGSDV